MPLNSSDSPEADGTHPNAIRFPMKDGDSTVFVTVSGLALDRRATRDRLQSSGDMATLFARYRKEIEAIASVKYDELRVEERAEIVIFAKDLAG
jgi:Protein of unknown function (DUF1488)